LPDGLDVIRISYKGVRETGSLFSCPEEIWLGEQKE
jgi:hypothetical protein